MAKGVRRAGGTPVLMPIADGGDGTAAVLGGREMRARIVGPYGERLLVRWRMRPGLAAVVEVAQAGLARTRKRAPLRARSDGVGQMILAAARAGARRVLVALGGSATVDAGTGMLRALGFWFADRNGERWERAGPPEAPAGIETTELRKSLRALPIVGCCDVLSRFLDAPRLYGPQKGASAKDVAELTRRFRLLARLAPPAHARLPGSGAAGGLGWALSAHLGARLRPGAQLVLEEIGFDRALRSADLVLTGEGSWDRTTREGKAPWEAMRRARAAGVPCVALCGVVAGRHRGVRAIARSEAEGMRRAASLLERAAYQETLLRADERRRQSPLFRTPHSNRVPSTDAPAPDPVPGRRVPRLSRLRVRVPGAPAGPCGEKDGRVLLAEAPDSSPGSAGGSEVVLLRGRIAPRDCRGARSGPGGA